MKRSEFLKLSCNACLLGAAGFVSVTELLSCSPATSSAVLKSSVSNGTISVAESLVSAGNVSIVRAKGLDFDIALRRTPDGTGYDALLLRCTHFSNPLVRSGSGYHCNLHGSEFASDGHVVKGPAAKPLRSLPCSVSEGNILIHV